MNKILKKLPIGEQSIKKLIEGNYIYVDKTEYVYNIITNNSYYFLSRPRRFGKSLLVSTFFEIFSGNKELFKDCWIYNSDYDWKSYPIIHLDFGTKKEDQRATFYERLFNQLKKMSNFYELNIDENNLFSYFEELIRQLYQKSGLIVFLVDEYDKPILDNIDNLEKANKNKEIVNGIFTVAKSLSGMLHFQFITGITKFSKTSIFSGANNLKDISMSEDYNCLLGYTQEELEFYFSDYLNLTYEKFNIHKIELLKKIKNEYNGYIFTDEWNLTETVYNPFSVLNFFSEKKFSNYWFQSGTPTFLIKLLSKYIYDFEENENNIYLDICDLNKFEVENINIMSLLFQAGYLTIDNYDLETKIIKLKYPNEEVRESFNKFIKDLIILKKQLKEITPNLKNYIENEDWNNAFITLNSFFKNISYGSASKYEHHYSSIFQGILQGAGFINCDSEVHTNDGRIDMVLYANSKIYIIEFKVNSKAEKAIEQIKKNNYMSKFLIKNKPIILIGVNFDIDEKSINDWKIEEYK